MARVTWSERSIQNMEEIAEYIAQDSVRNAVQTTAKIYQTAERLELFPESGRTVPELRATSLREIIVGNYRIVYAWKRDKCVILTVLHSRRNLRKTISKK